MQLGKINSEDLRLLLDIYPKLEKEYQEACDLIPSNLDRFVGPGCIKPVWCHLYEKSFNEHLAIIIQSYDMLDEVKELATSTNPIQAIPEFLDSVEREIDEWEPSDEESQLLRKMAPVNLGYALSLMLSFRSLMTFGLYLNELVAKVRDGVKEGDKALFSAIKIDPTVLGCPSAQQRLARAVMLDEKDFFSDLRKAIRGKLTKREQRTYKEMRLVLQVLYETKAPALGEDDLYRLFVKELKLVREERNSDVGNVANNLRQFAYQFIKHKPVS